MDTCEVAIVGGGPAGSTCAWALRERGVDVVVIDAARFPRDKVCAGWITPEVIDRVGIDPAQYREGRTFQPITGFRVGVIGRDRAVEATYDRAVSFGIRRCEFDYFLLQRCGARVRLGEAVVTIRRRGTDWILNEAVSARMLVGAGGHGCPVNRLLNRPTERTAIVAAEESECRVAAEDAARLPIAGERPELYFCSDFAGYGWCFRKQDYLNVGFGHVAARALPAERDAFVEFLRAAGRLTGQPSWRWRGHAYRVSMPSRRQFAAAGAVLVGDSAGLADPRSGEGIGPAIQSGLLAAATIAACDGRYRHDDLDAYARSIQARFGAGARRVPLLPMVPSSMAAWIAKRLTEHPWFVRHVVLDRWFLHRTAAARGV